MHAVLTNWPGAAGLWQSRQGSSARAQRCMLNPMHRPTVQPMPHAAAASTSADAVPMRERVTALEAAAMDAHVVAQRLNKEGRFDEAKAAYAEMRRLDAAALEAARELASAEGGAVTTQQQQRAREETDVDTQQRAFYGKLHTPPPWNAIGQVTGSLSARQRAAGAVMGCIVGDAAATPVQWMYDVAALQALLSELRRRHEQQAPENSSAMPGLEFHDPVVSPFLQQYSTGRCSPYGEQTLVLLRSLAEQRGLHCDRYAALYAEAYTGFDGYMNASTVAFMRNHASGALPPATGADDAQADCVTRLAPLLAAFSGDGALMTLVAAATRVTQDSPTAVAWACTGAAVLERLMCGQRAVDAVMATVDELRAAGSGGGSTGRMPIEPALSNELAGHLERAVELAAKPHDEAVEALGRNCHAPNSVQTPLHAVLHAEWCGASRGGSLCDLSLDERRNTFAAAIRGALEGGGCCASRAGFAGACLGALMGAEAIPATWVQRTHAAADVTAWTERLCKARDESDLRF